MFVDDEASIVKMAKQMLERYGYTVIGKTSSTDALKLFQEEPGRFDLVISDMSMPQMGGDHLAVELFKVRSNIPIILCTGHSDRMDEQKAKNIGISAYTMKPLTKNNLLRTVKKVLDDAKFENQD